MADEKKKLEAELKSSRHKHNSIKQDYTALLAGLQELQGQMTSLTEEVSSYHDLLQEEKERGERLQRDLEEAQVSCPSE